MQYEYTRTPQVGELATDFAVPVSHALQATTQGKRKSQKTEPKELL